MIGTNAEVNKFNVSGLNKLNTELVVSEAINIYPTITNFKAHVNSKGNVGTERNETPFRQTLNMKIKARIMLRKSDVPIQYWQKEDSCFQFSPCYPVSS